MPYIEHQLSVALSGEQQKNIKRRLGEAVTLLGKSENYLMVGFHERCDLYFAGKKLERGAYVAVSLYGRASSSAYEKLTERICAILGEEAAIPPQNIYVTYREVGDWGWNGGNF